MSRKEIDSPRADVGEPVPPPLGLRLQKQRSESEGPRTLALPRRSVAAGIPPGERGEDAASCPAKEQSTPPAGRRPSAAFTHLTLARS